MRRRDWLGGCALLMGVFQSGALSPALAEFGVGLGEIEKPTSAASARFNEGLSSFHLMLAALDKKDLEPAMKTQIIAVQQFMDAAILYEAAVKMADGHLLKPSPKTDQEQADVMYFDAHAEAYGVKLPVSQRDLINAISGQVRKFSARIKSEDPRTLVRDLRRQQALSNSATELQTFLVSTTTMLTLG
jgi:hypothetical protein